MYIRKCSRRPELFIAVLLIITGVTGLTALHAGAGETPPGQNPPTKSVELEAVTVTAQKQEEKLQEVPASVTAFSDIQIEDAGIEDTFDLTKFSPNLHMQENYIEHIVVTRGVSSFNTSIYSPMGYYVDDVGYPLHFMHNPEFLDIERIEVLRGPQGTLYGRNSESGVINIITRAPDNLFRGEGIAEYGSYNSYRLGGKISGPLLEDKLYAGLALQTRESDGYVENELDNDDEVADSDRKNGRLSLRWTPVDEWDISFISNFMDANAGVGGYRWIDGPRKTDAFKVRHDADEYSKQDGNDQVLRMEYSGGAFTLLSVSSLLHYKHDILMEADLWDDPDDQTQSRVVYKNRQYSQEFRISSPKGSGGPFKWLAGVYGFRDKTDIDYNYLVVNKPAWFMSDTSYTHPVSSIEGTGIAGFGQGTYTIADRLRLTAGLRYDYQRLEGEITGQYLDMMTFSQADYNLEENLETNELLPKFSAAYDLSNDVMVYATVSKGYITGGYNNLLTPNELTLTYDPEYTWNYEAGIKSMWFNNRLMANLTVFYIDITDKQVAEVDGDTVTSVIRNAAEAHSQGIELEFQTRPAEGLDIFASLGYTEAKFDKFVATDWNADQTALIQKDYEGKHLPYAPKFTFNLGAQYRHPTGLFCRADFFGTDRFYGDYGNSAEQEAYHTVNLRLGYEGERFDCVLWGQNIFDEEYLTYVSNYGQYNMGLDGAPQTFGVTFKVRF